MSIFRANACGVFTYSTESLLHNMGAVRAGHLDQLVHVYLKVIKNIHLYYLAGVWVFSLFPLVLVCLFFVRFCFLSKV
jgi:hypothetical protein